MNHISTKFLFGLLAFSILFASCKKEPEVVVAIDKEEFDLDDQKDIGQNLSNLITSPSSNHEVLSAAENAEFYAYINQLFSTVVNTNMVENRNTFDWEVIVLKDDDMRSIFTIPGGKLFIYTGLLKTINSENELFSILAHELYYTDKSIVIDAMISEYGSFVLGDLILDMNTNGARDIAATIHNMKFSTANVKAADQFALEIICPFQYEARGLKTFIENAVNLSEDIQWLENRPGSADRLTLIENHAEDCGLEELTFEERYDYNKALLP